MRGRNTVLFAVVGLLGFLVGVVATGQPVEAQTPGGNWEYITLVCSEQLDSADVYCGGYDDVNLLMTERHSGDSLIALTQTLNIYGSVGWELVSVVTDSNSFGVAGWQAFMKRRVA